MATTTWDVLEPLDDALRTRFLALAREQRHGRGEAVFMAGDPADSFHLVVSGQLAVKVGLPDGSLATVNVLGPGTSFGELALFLPERRRTATVVALAPSLTLAIHGTAFIRLCQARPDMMQKLAALLATRIDQLTGQVVEALHTSLDFRVRRWLSTLARHAAPAGLESVTIPLTQAQLAELCGGTRQGVNQVLQRLADHDVVALARGRVTVLDRDALLSATAGDGYGLDP